MSDQQIDEWVEAADEKVHQIVKELADRIYSEVVVPILKKHKLCLSIHVYSTELRYEGEGDWFDLDDLPNSEPDFVRLKEALRAQCARFDCFDYDTGHDYDEQSFRRE